MEKEEWRDIPGYEGVYKVSNLGKVKSIKFKNERILKPDKDRGYHKVSLYTNGTRKKYFVHRLVCCAFLDLNLLSSELVVNHINGIKDDNRLYNLEVISQLANVIDGVIRKTLDEDNNSDNIKYITKGKWEVYYKNVFLGEVKNIEQAMLVIRTAKLLFEILAK